jgi:ribosomal-protein-alanine N-acetyltransferase
MGNSLNILSTREVTKDLRIKVLEHLDNSWNFWTVEDVEDTLLQRNTEGFFLVEEPLLDPSNVKGFVFYSCSYENADLLYIYVPPEQRRSGLASKILDQSLRRLFQKGIDKVTLEVRESNEGAQEFYDRFGFETIDKRSNYYKDGENALVMTKELNYN